jgi:membrane protease YdiL (CAAX protease family)
MTQKVETGRILIFLGVAFGISWGVALVIYLTGGLVNSPPLIPGTPITMALVLLSGGYMLAPAMAHVITRLVTREGWRHMYLIPAPKREWPYWLLAWCGPAVLTILGGILFFALFPQYLDTGLTTLKELLAAGGGPPLNPWLVVLLQTGAAIVIAPLINSFFTLGEEFGWRAYLQPKLLVLGPRPMFVLTGLIWGVWHWPIIAMGHNYGLTYPGAPWLGPLTMVWFTFIVGIYLGWLTLRAGSVWPAVIGHAALNGIASLGALFVQGEPNPLLGPLPVGVIGLLPWTLFSLWMFFNAEMPDSDVTVPAGDGLLPADG